MNFIIKIGRFFQEMTNPVLKCERLGHKILTKEIKIRKSTKRVWDRAIVEDFSAKKDICTRCKKYHPKPYSLKYIDSFTSCSMPTKKWDEIRINGYVEL